MKKIVLVHPPAVVDDSDPGAAHVRPTSEENSILTRPACCRRTSGNQFSRIFGDGGPARNDDLYGMVQLNGNFNSVTGNHFSFSVPPENVMPAGAAPTIVLVKGALRISAWSGSASVGPGSSQGVGKVVVSGC